MKRVRVLPTLKEWPHLIRRVVAFGAGFAVWFYCSKLEGYASSQTGTVVPANMQMCRDVVSWLWFPFSWLPSSSYIGDFWGFLEHFLIGVPYGVIVAFTILRLFRTSQPKKR